MRYRDDDGGSRFGAASVAGMDEVSDFLTNSNFHRRAQKFGGEFQFVAGRGLMKRRPGWRRIGPILAFTVFNPATAPLAAAFPHRGFPPLATQLSSTNLIMNTQSRLRSAWRFAAISVGVLAIGLSNASAFVLGPTAPGKWGPPVMGTGATVTWSIMAGGIATPGDDGLTVGLGTIFPPGFHAALTAAFAAWSAVADITFIEVADSGLPFNAAGAGGDIRIGAHAFDGPSGTLAHGFFPPVNGTSAAGDIHFDSAELWKIGFGGPGFDIFQVAAHEIGHAIGLAHTGVPASLMNPFYTEAFSGPQADDIGGAVFIYGPRRAVGAPDSGSTIALGLMALLTFAALRRRVA